LRREKNNKAFRKLTEEFVSTDKRLVTGISGSSYYWFIPYKFDALGRADGASIEESDADTLLLIMMGVDEKVDQYKNKRLSNAKWQEILELWHFILFEAETFDDAYEKLLIVDYDSHTVGCDRIIYYVNNYGKRMWDNRADERPLCDNFKRWFDLVSRHYQGIVFEGI